MSYNIMIYYVKTRTRIRVSNFFETFKNATTQCNAESVKFGVNRSTSKQSEKCEQTDKVSEISTSPNVFHLSNKQFNTQ